MKQPNPNVVSHAAEIVRNSARCADPIESAQLLPAEAYVSEDFWQFEKWAIFAREWIFVGHVNQVPRPRDYLSRTVLGEPILIIRDGDGKIHVLSAICQHRGHPLVGGLKAQPQGSGCRQANQLVCPYHAWTYNLDGSFAWAPEMERTTPIAVLKTEIRLPAFRTEIFHGLIFINFSADAPALHPSLEKLDRAITTFNLADMIPMPIRVNSDLKWNWKVHHENALEPYHTDYVHQTSHNVAPASLSEFMEFAPGDSQIMTTTRFRSTDVDLFTGGDGRNMPHIPGLTDKQRNRLLFVSVMPTFFGVFQPSSVMLSVILPRGAGLMDTHRFALYPKTTVDAPDFQELYERQISRQAGVIQEDITTQTAVHDAHHSMFTPRGRLSWLETTIPQMNQWLLSATTARYKSFRFPHE